MSKDIKKTLYKSYSPQIIKKLKEKYGLTTQFIGASLRGDRSSETSIKICEDYKKMETEINKTLNKL